MLLVLDMPPQRIRALFRKKSIPPIILIGFAWLSRASTVDFVYHRGGAVLKATWRFLQSHNWVYFAIGLGWLTIIALFDDLKRLLLSRFASRELDEVKFLYLPDEPLKHGWTVGYEDPGPPAFFSAPSHKLGENGLSVDVGKQYAIDYAVAPPARTAGRLRFNARYTHSTMIFTRLEVVSAEESGPKKVWVKYYFARRAYAEPSKGSFPQDSMDLPEQTVWLKANLEDEWMKFNINLSKVVKLVLGAKWKYHSLQAIRLRGSLSISSISILA